MRSDHPPTAFTSTGHLSDAAVTAIADGELDMVSDDALHHCADCEPCEERVMQAAQLSIALDTLLLGRGAELAPAPPPAGARWALVFGLAAAFMGVFPWLMGSGWGDDLGDALHTAPGVMSAVGTSLRVLSRETTVTAIATACTTILLLLIGLSVARSFQKRTVGETS